MSFQTDSMIPIGSLQPSSNNFPAVNENQSQHQQQQLNQQASYPGLPHAPTAMQAKDMAPQTQQENQSPLNPALMTQAHHHQQQQPGRPDPFGGTPFLPPPPKSNRSGTQGRYHFPSNVASSAADQQMVAAVGLGEDRYAVFEALSGGQPNQGEWQIIACIGFS